MLETKVGILRLEKPKASFIYILLSQIASWSNERTRWSETSISCTLASVCVMFLSTLIWYGLLSYFKS